MMLKEARHHPQVQWRVPLIAKRAVSEMGGSKQVSDKTMIATAVPAWLQLFEKSISICFEMLNHSSIKA
jgi:hypothetical protein